MGRRIREFDWAATPLGRFEEWPQALRGALGICLQSSFPTAIYWGPELRVLYNDAWAPIVGDKHPGALGQPARQVWPDIWGLLEPQFRQVMEHGQGHSSFDQLLPMQRGDRVEETWWTYNLTPILDSEGRPAGVFNQGNETTENVLAARERKQEIERLRELFYQAPGAVAVLRGPSHVFEMINPAYAELVGGRDVVGKPVIEALPEVVEQGFVDILDRAYQSGEALTGRSTVVRLQQVPGAQTDERQVDFVYQPTRSASGRVNGIFVLATDVTDRARAYAALRRSETELREADRRKNEFLAMLGHELRNPLAPILSATRLLQFKGEADAGLRKASDIIERQVNHMVRLVDDLLEVSRITRGVIELRKARIAVASLIENAIESARPLIDERRHRLEVDLPRDPLMLDGDPVRLQQALLNLLNNAARYTPAGGRITVKAARRGDSVEISVEDDGLGIPEASLEEIFELFARGDAARATSVGGLGLGLSLARDIARLHAGTLRAESEGAGRGSRFTLALPAATDQSEGTKGNGDAANDAERRANRVLIVDDNADAADSLALNLEFSGHLVRTAYDGLEALQVLEGFTPEVALLDIGMPGMDGLQLARAIRERSDGQGITLVALTGLSQAEDKRRAARAGFNEYLTKPVDPAVIDALVRRLA